MRNIFLYLLLISILILLIVNLIPLKKNINLNSNHEKNLTLELYTNQIITESIRNNSVKISIEDNKEILNKLQMYSSVNKPVLILTFSAFSCKSCVDFSRKKVHEHFDNFILNNRAVFIVSNFENYNVLRNESVTIMKFDNLGIPLEETNQPFFFILHNGVAQNIFVPDKEFPIFTDIYLNELRKKYFLN
ncbi:MAG: hypothetical protein PHS59_17265 [Paludibacter sp.]|nr:hypothetical protein [Paludibacter sp.]